MNVKAEVQRLVDDYWKWMSDKTVLREVDDDWIELNTPIMDRHNDGLQLYMRKVENNYVISDDGYTLTDLLHSGVNTETPKRQEIIDNILTLHNVTLSDGALQIHTTTEDFSSKKMIW